MSLILTKKIKRIHSHSVINSVFCRIYTTEERINLNELHASFEITVLTLLAYRITAVSAGISLLYESFYVEHVNITWLKCYLYE